MSEQSDPNWETKPPRPPADDAEHEPETEPGTDESTEPTGFFMASASSADAESLAPMDATTSLRPTSPTHYPSIGEFEIDAKLGRGGMGIVYRARDKRLQRTVAIKVLRSGVGADDEELTRFRREAQLIAQLQHPRIVQVYEVGDSDGLMYVVLEYMNAGSLRELLDGTPLDESTAVSLMAELAGAVAAAHERGVIHRDLKPGNILVSMNRNVQHGQARPTLADLSTAAVECKIADFGLAKNLNADHEQTVSGMILGTPRYAAPEQLSGDTKSIGPATDVYALGAVLFEFVTGTPVFQSANTAELIKAVQEREAVSPRALNPTISRDLETICLKCLQKQPTARYATALELGNDLLRLQKHEPIVARPVGWRERSWKWVRRNPLATALLGTIGLTLIALAAVSAGLIYQEELTEANLQLTGAQLRLEQQNAQLQLHNEALKLAQSEAASARVELEKFRFANDMQLAGRAWNEGDIAAVRKILARYPGDLANKSGGDLRGWEWHYLSSIANSSLRQLTGYEACYSPDGRLLAVSRGDAIHLLDPNTFHSIRQMQHSHQSRQGLNFSGDGKRLIAGMPDRSFVVWNIEDGQQIAKLIGHEWSGRAELDNDGSHALTMGYADDRTAMLWNVMEAKPLASWDLKQEVSYPGGLAFSPDGKWFAIGWPVSGSVKIGTVESPESVRDVSVGNPYSSYHANEPAVLFDPQQPWLYASLGGEVSKVPLDGDLEQPLAAQSTAIYGSLLNLTANGQTMVTCDTNDHSIRIWDLPSQQQRNYRRGYTGDPQSFSLQNPAARSDGRMVGVSCHAASDSIWLWDCLQPPEFQVIHSNFSVQNLDYSPDGSMLAVAGFNGKVAVWNEEQWMELTGASGSPWEIKFSPDSRLLAVTTLTGSCYVWRVSDRTLHRTYQSPSAGGLYAVAFSDDGSQMLLTDNAAHVLVYDSQTGKELRRYNCNVAVAYYATFIPGTTDVVSLSGQGMTFWNHDPPKQIVGTGSSKIAFNADASSYLTLAGVLQNDVLQVNANTGQTLQTFSGHRATASQAKFLDNEQRIVSVGDTNGRMPGTGTLRIWDAATGQETLRLDSGGSRCIAVHPDGQTFAITGDGWRVRVYSSQR